MGINTWYKDGNNTNSSSSFLLFNCFENLTLYIIYKGTLCTHRHCVVYKVVSVCVCPLQLQAILWKLLNLKLLTYGVKCMMAHAHFDDLDLNARSQGLGRGKTSAFNCLNSDHYHFYATESVMRYLYVTIPPAIRPSLFERWKILNGILCLSLTSLALSLMCQCTAVDTKTRQALLSKPVQLYKWHWLTRIEKRSLSVSPYLRLRLNSC